MIPNPSNGPASFTMGAPNPLATHVSAAAPPSYDAIALNPNGPRSRTNLFVRKLASAVVEQDLKVLFQPYGQILSFALMRDIHTGESLGTAFVRFATHEQAKAAMVALDEKPLYGRPISIQWAKRQHDSTPVGEARARIHKLFVRNIPLDVTTRRLRQLFSPYGTIANVTLHSDTSPPTAGSHHTTTTTTSAAHDESGGASTMPPHMFTTLSKAGASEPGVHHDVARNIAFVVFSEDGAADAAVEALHNTSPFPTCDGVPLMVKLAEDNRQRLERRLRFPDGEQTLLQPSLTTPGGTPPSAQMMGLPSSMGTVSGLPYAAHPLMLSSGHMVLQAPAAGLPSGTNAPYVLSAAPSHPFTTGVNASATATPPAASPGQYVLLSTNGGAPQSYWLQPVSPSPAPQASVAVPAPMAARTRESLSGTPPLFYSMPAAQPGALPRTAGTSTPPGLVMSLATGAQKGTPDTYGTAGQNPNVARGTPSAGGSPFGATTALGGHSQQHSRSGSTFTITPAFSPQARTTPENMSPVHEAAAPVANARRFPQPFVFPLQQTPQLYQQVSIPGSNNNLNASSPICVANSPNSLGGSQSIPSSHASRTGMSTLSHNTTRRGSGEYGPLGSTTNSALFMPNLSPKASSPLVSGFAKPSPVLCAVPGRSVDHTANGMSLSSLHQRRVLDASVDAEATLTDQDTAYSSVRLDNSANLTGQYMMNGGMIGFDDEHDMSCNVADTDMSEAQLLAFARNMALLEDHGGFSDTQPVLRD